MIHRIRSEQIQHKNIVLNKILEEVEEDHLIIQSLTNLLIQKNILTKEEVKDFVDSIKVMNKLIKNWLENKMKKKCFLDEQFFFKLKENLIKENSLSEREFEIFESIEVMAKLMGEKLDLEEVSKTIKKLDKWINDFVI